MTSRIPSAAKFRELSTQDRLTIVEHTRREIDEQIVGLRSGYIFLTDGRSRAHHLRLLRARRQRLVKLAHEVGLGYLLKDQPIAA